MTMHHPRTYGGRATLIIGLSVLVFVVLTLYLFGAAT
jgi:hypothetical protein